MMMRNRSKGRIPGQSGVTLVELMTALVITGIAVTAILSTYVFAQKLMFKWSNQSEMVGMATGIEKTLRRETANADSVKASGDKLELYQKGSCRVIENTGDQFVLQGRPLALNKAIFKMVSVTVLMPAPYTKSAFIQWHCRLVRNGKTLEWLGGNRMGQ